MDIFGIMIFFGLMTFLCFGLMSGLSIEAHENEKIAKLFAFLTFLGIISFLIGLIGSIIFY